MADVNTLRNKVRELEKALANANTGHGLPYPEYFDGTEEIGPYINRFNKIATGHGWDYARCTTIFPLYLRGEARAFYDSMANDEKDTWLKLTTNLAKGLSRYNSTETARRLLSERKQENDESILEFAESLRKLVEKAFPNSSFALIAGESDPDREARIKSWKSDLTKDYFRNGIKIELKIEVAFMRSTSLDEAISQARQVEQIKEALSAEQSRHNEDQITEMAMKEIKAVQIEVDEILQEFNNDDYGDINPEDREFEYDNCHSFEDYTQDFQPEYNEDSNIDCPWNNNYDTNPNNFDPNGQEFYGDEQYLGSEQYPDDDPDLSPMEYFQPDEQQNFYRPEENTQRIGINSLSMPILLVMAIFCLLSPAVAEYKFKNVEIPSTANSNAILFHGKFIDDFKVHGEDERIIEEWPKHQIKFEDSLLGPILNLIFGDVDVAMAIEGEDGGFQAKFQKIIDWKKNESIIKSAPKKMEVFMAISKDEKNEKNHTDENSKPEFEKFTIEDDQKSPVESAKAQAVQRAKENDAEWTKGMSKQEDD